MINLVLASLFLPVSHFGLSSTRLREAVVERLGQRRFITVYEMIALGALAWLVVAYRHAPLLVLWIAPRGTKLAVLPVVWLAFFLVLAGVTTANPTIVGAEKLFDRPDIVRGVVRVTRNSFLWGVALWACAHIAATGDLASILMFGSIGSLGLIGAPLLDAKKARRHGDKWRRFAASTSSVPFVAILQGRQHLSLVELKLWRLALATALFVAFLYAHRFAFGVSALPTSFNLR
jgi:uncharacterized membrane protein